MGLFNRGAFALRGGEMSNYKIDCDALTDDDIECIALMLSQRVPAFGETEGVPKGGLRLANAMKQYATAGPLLICEDVWTTGGSMEGVRKGREAVGAVIFARRKPAAWVMPLFQM